VKGVSLAETNADSGASKRPVRPLPRARYDAKRRDIIDIAARLYAVRGYHATSIDDLVEATGLRRGGLYHYIDGKHDLLVAIHGRFIDPLLETARGIVAEGLAPEIALGRLAHALMSAIATYQDHVTVFLNDWRAITEEPGWCRIHQARQEFESIVESVLSEGCAAGVFTIGEIRLATMAFLGMINYSYQWYDAHGPLTPDELAHELATIFLSGVLSPPARLIAAEGAAA
jgi:AcrR family transcriptional regulator